MRFFYLIALAILLPTCALQAQIGTLLWEENFNSLDGSVWNATDGDGCPGLCGFGNQELQSYEPENLSIESVPGEPGNSPSYWKHAASRVAVVVSPPVRSTRRTIYPYSTG